MIKEFREFIERGNVIELAVAFVMGVAFNAIIKSFVADIIMPLVGLVTGGVDFRQTVSSFWAQVSLQPGRSTRSGRSDAELWCVHQRHHRVRHHRLRSVHDRTHVQPHAEEGRRGASSTSRTATSGSSARRNSRRAERSKRDCIRAKMKKGDPSVSLFLPR